MIDKLVFIVRRMLSACVTSMLHHTSYFCAIGSHSDRELYSTLEHSTSTAWPADEIRWSMSHQGSEMRSPHVRGFWIRLEQIRSLFVCVSISLHTVWCPENTFAILCASKYLLQRLDANSSCRTNERTNSREQNKILFSCMCTFKRCEKVRKQIDHIELLATAHVVTTYLSVYPTCSLPCKHVRALF